MYTNTCITNTQRDSCVLNCLTRHTAVSHCRNTPFYDEINRIGATGYLYDINTCFVSKKGSPYIIYMLPSVGPGADPGVQAVSPQVTISHPTGGRLPLLSTRPAVNFPATPHHHLLAGTKL